MKNFFKNILTSGYEIEVTDERYARLIVINISLYLGIVSSIVFLFNAFLHSEQAHVIPMHIFAFLIDLSIIIYLRKTLKIELISYIYVILLFLVLLFAATNDAPEHLPFIGMFFFPLVTFLLLANRVASLIVSLFFFVVMMLVIFAIMPETIYLKKNTTLFLNISIIYILILVLGYWYEFSRTHMHYSFSSANALLNKKIKRTLTELEKKELLLLQQTKMAQLGTLMAAISHQWKQPLAIIRSITTQLSFTAEAGCDKEKIIKNIQDIDTQIDFMLKTMQEFRNFYKPRQDEQEFSLFEATKFCTTMLNEALIKNRITIHIDIDKSLSIYSYEHEFEQLLLNLIDNAIDALSTQNISKPFIRISAKKEDTNILYSIEDNAKGIEADILEHIFEPHTSTKASEGSGIGLYIAKQIIEELMQGTIRVENTTQGARFTLTLPLR